MENLRKHYFIKNLFSFNRPNFDWLLRRPFDRNYFPYLQIGDQTTYYCENIDFPQNDSY